MVYFQDATKVLIVISTPSEIELNVDGPVQDTEMPSAVGEEISHRMISSDKASYTAQASDAENCSQVAAVENGTGSRQPSPKVQHGGDGDQGERHMEELSKCNTGDRMKVKIPYSPSASTAAQKKHCGSGCCTVS